MTTRDGSRLAAIQMLARLVMPNDPKLDDEVAEKFNVCMFTLGVTREEIGDAMSFAIISGGAK